MANPWTGEVALTIDGERLTLGSEALDAPGFDLLAFVQLAAVLVHQLHGQVSLDNAGYYRADELFKEVELVLEATCTACSAGR